MVPIPNRGPHPDDDKRGGYTGSAEAATVPPPAPVPSASFPQVTGGVEPAEQHGER